ncbi:MAG: YHS domain-containing (seleno)protein [Bacteroidota bacterium]
MKKALIIIAFLALAVSAQAQSDKTRGNNFNIRHNVAIGGYDPVSYFDGKPAKGSKTIAYAHHGVTYYFAKEANKNKFKADPQRYEPAYGGWCAYAMGVSGDKVKIDPGTYKITDGKLYLFYNFSGTNTLTLWNKDEPGLITKGDNYWDKILTK